MNEPNRNFDTFAWKTQLMIDENQVQLIIINGFELFEELVDSEKEEYRDREKEEEAQFHIAKNLNGWTGIADLTYNPKTMSFKKESDE